MKKQSTSPASEIRNRSKDIYILRDISFERLNQEIDLVWQALDREPHLRDSAKNAGVDIDRLKSRPTVREKALRVEIYEQYADPATVAIVIAFAPVAAKLTRDLWDNIILPWIEKRNGSGVITEAPKVGKTTRRKAKK